MKTAQMDLQMQRNKQEHEQKQEQEQFRQKKQNSETVGAYAVAQLFAAGRESLLRSGLMNRETAARLGNAAVIRLMGEEGYIPEHLPENSEETVDPADVDAEAVPSESLP